MSKQYNIRWGRSDYAKLSHLVKKVNKKVFEIEVKRPDISEYQPEMLDYHDVKSQIKTRRDFKNLVNKYERYLREGVEEVIKTERGGVLTKFDANEIKIRDLTDNAKRAKTRERLGDKNVTIAGKDTGTQRAKMGDVKENDVKPRTHNIKNMSQGDIKNALRLIDKKIHSTYNDEMQQQMIENYVKGLISEGYSDELLQIINKIPADVFREIIDLDETATFDFIYDPLELKSKEDLIIDTWQQYVDENVDNHIDYDGIRETVEMEYDKGMRIKGYGRIKTKRRRR